jgi:hypothetical protein
MHPLVRELVALLPTDGEAFPQPARKRWVVAVEAAFELLYGEEVDDQPSTRARHRALPLTEADPDQAGLADHGEQRFLADLEPRHSGDYPADYLTDYADGQGEHPTTPVDYAATSADYQTEYGSDANPPADPDDEWRHATDRTTGAMYSSYTWDSSSP